jgi:hypothetical protein
MVTAGDSKSPDPCGPVGSSPTPGTKRASGGMADAQVLGTCAVRCEGSTPSSRTTYKIEKFGYNTCMPE